MEEEKNLIPFTLYYNTYADDKVTPLTYRVGGHLLPPEIYDNILVDPNTGQIVIPGEDIQKLAAAPTIEGLNYAPTWKETFATDIAPVLDAINSFRNLTGILSDLRVKNALEHPEVMNAILEGENIAGNIIMLPVTSAVGLTAMEGLATTAGLARAAWLAKDYVTASKLIGSIAGAVVGGKVGHDVGDAAIRNITGGQYGGLADFMNKSTGIWAYNTEMVNPFTLGGGYLGSYAGSALAGGNWRSSLQAGQAETVMTPEGAQQVQFENTPTVLSGRYAEAPNAAGGSSAKTGVGYSRSVNGGFNRTSGLARQAGLKGGPRQQGKTTGVKGDRLSDNRSKSGGETPTWEVTGGQFTPVVAPVGNTFVPFFGHITNTVPRMMIPIPEKHLEEQSLTRDPFESWFSKQIPGSTLYWPGDSNSTVPPGYKRIIRGGDFGTIDVEQTRLGVGRPDNLGRSIGTPAKDYGRSRRQILAPWSPDRKHYVRVTEEEGALPNVTLSPGEAPIIYYPDLQ